MKGKRFTAKEQTFDQSLSITTGKFIPALTVVKLTRKLHEDL